MKNILFSLLVLILASRAECDPLIPKDYSGDKASVGDTFQRRDIASACYYYIKSIDGNKIANAFSNSIAEGSYVVTRGATREVPVQPMKVLLVAIIGRALTGKGDPKKYIEEEVDFLPVANMDYLVKGVLSKKYSAVWIEDSNGKLATKRVEGTNRIVTNSVVDDELCTPAQSSNIQNAKLDTFLKISGGESSELVVKKLGNPDSISEVTPSLFAAQPLYTAIIYEYKGLGKIQFLKYGSDLTVDKIIRNAQGVGEDANSIKQRLNAESAMSLRLHAQEYYNADIPSVEILDVFAEKIWHERNTEDPNMADAMAWFCRLIGKSKNPRYKSFLKSVAHETSLAKLKKHAEGSLKLLPAQDVEQFSPGESK